MGAEAMRCDYGSEKRRQSSQVVQPLYLQRLNMPNQFEETAASIKDIIMGNSLGAEELRSWRLVAGELYMISAFLCTGGGRKGRLAGAF